MIELEFIEDLHSHLAEIRSQGKKISFVPTMGALHQGHLSLIAEAKKYADFVVASIYINPLQFNNNEDFLNYPSTLDRDRELLFESGCSLLYLPKQEELFPKNIVFDYQLGSLVEIMEGKYRPGHFQGMAAVVERFFRLIEPDYAFFGEKDFQQFAIVSWLVEELNLGIEVHACPTVRNAAGLALSSRNIRLSETDLNLASQIYQSFQYCKENRQTKSLESCLETAKKQLEKDFELDYLLIVDEKSLQVIEDWNQSDCPRIFIAAYLSGVRLIDNMSLID